MRAASLSPAAAVRRTLVRVLRAVLSLVVLLATVAGLPVLLAWATPVIWSSTHDDVHHLLDRQDTGALFLLLLVAVAWIGWASFSFCTARELVAQVRGRSWRPPRGLGASQRAAALLVGSIVVLLPTSSALASEARAAPAAPAATAAHAPQSQQADNGDQGLPPSSARAAAGARSSYTVREMRPAESLWAIAERELGDGERWREIARLNDGRVMTHGQVFRANSFLQPGWTLEMPTPTDTPDGPQEQLRGEATTSSSGHAVTVHSGDYLSKIAEEELGDGTKWPVLFAASEGKPQPDGLPEITNPNVIYAGQQVTVPVLDEQPDEPSPLPSDPGRDTADEPQLQDSAPPAARTPGIGQPPGQHGEGEDARAPGRSADSTPEVSAPRTPGSPPTEQPGHEQSPATATPDTGASPSATAPSESAAPAGAAGSSSAAVEGATPASAPSEGLLNLRTVLGAGALLAGALTGALAVRRALQRRRRKPGETIAIAAETSPAEAQLAAAGEPGGTARLDVALRTMAHQLSQQHDAVLPPVQAVRIGTRAIAVLSEDPAQGPPAPFVTGTDGWWALPGDAILLDEETAREVPAPYPGLVTIGSVEGGDLLLLNLAQLPALLLDGDPLHITEVCTSIALELAMSPWAGEIDVVTIGFGEELPQLLPTTRIAHMRQANHARRDLGERLLEAHQMPDTGHQPYLLLCASALDPDTAWEFADIIDKAGPVPVTLIAPAVSAAAHFPEAPILNASLNTPQHLETVGADVIVQRLEHSAYLQITTALKVTAQPAHPVDGPWKDVPDDPDRDRPQEQPAPTNPGEPGPEAAASPSAAPAATVDMEVFPALLAATTDPSGLRLLSPAPPLPQTEKENGPGTDTPTATKAPGPRTNASAAPDGDQDTAALSHEAYALQAPEIRVLGPVSVTGVDNTGHGPRMAQLAALLYFRSGRNADVVCSDMDPASPWTPSTLNARLQGLRRALGNDPAGAPYVPRRKAGDDPYRLSPGVRCDWNHFLHLAENALPQGTAGLADLEKALALVRGRPFGGRPLPWAEPYQQEMTTRIIDVAHTVATHRTPAGPHHDLSTARRAVATGLDIDDTAELLYRDWLRIEHAAGNRQGLHTAITRVQQVNRALDCSLEAETEHLISDLLNGSGPAVRKAL